MRHLILCLLMVFSLPVLASDPQLRGEYQKWLVYDYQESNGHVCYAMTRADKTVDAKGKILKIKDRGQVLLQITRRTAEGNGLVFSYVSGHTIKSKTDVLATLGKTHFHLRAEGDTAWTNNPTADADIVSAIRKAKNISLVHQDRKGNSVTDYFSSKGAVAALDALAQCQ